MALKKTHAQFHAALKFWGDPGELLRAMRACWWFIENVTPDDPARSDIFFELRSIVYEAELIGEEP